ncbi:MAG: AmmeMemoRadiSam system radical SAM enzyme [Armatimonadota bacterium]
MSLRTVSRRRFLKSASKGIAGALAGGLIVGRTRAQPDLGKVAEKEARYWKRLESGEIQCGVCPHACSLKDGALGKCRQRKRVGDALISLVYGRPCVIQVLPIEQDGFNHVMPGNLALTVGTAGCVLSCRYCETWQVSQAAPMQTANEDMSPARIVATAKEYRLKIVTFTINDAVGCVEYVIDTANALREQGIKCVAHTCAYINPKPLKDLCAALDAINVDLKGYTESFYKSIVGGKLRPVLTAIKTIVAQGTFLEITNLVIPGQNDGATTFKNMCRWILENCGPDVPLHVRRFFPKHMMLQVPSTPTLTLKNLRKAAYATEPGEKYLRVGYNARLRYVYVDNMPGDPGEWTYCPRCKAPIIRRIGTEALNVGFNPKLRRCRGCQLPIPGVWETGANPQVPPPPPPPKEEKANAKPAG